LQKPKLHDHQEPEEAYGPVGNTGAVAEIIE